MSQDNEKTQVLTDKPVTSLSEDLLEFYNEHIGFMLFNAPIKCYHDFQQLVQKARNETKETNRSN